jgi:hypothetical protein
VRVRGAGAVRPIQSGGLSFDVLAAMESVDMMGEKRTGIMRFGQGLKADTLHETAAGVIEQGAMMMKRVRLMAKLMAETGVKDLALGLHKIMRMHSTHEFRLRRSEEIIPLDPVEWADRQDMTVEIGVGSGGRREKIESRQILGDALGSAIQYQGGGLNGPIVTADNVFAYYEGLIRDLGYKDAARFVSDPAQAGQAPPDPEKEQMRQALEQMQMQQNDTQQKMQVEMAKIQSNVTLKEMQMQMEGQLKQMQMQMEGQLKQLEIQMRQQSRAEETAAKMTTQVKFGGDVG